MRFSKELWRLQLTNFAAFMPKGFDLGPFMATGLPFNSQDLISNFLSVCHTVLMMFVWRI